MVRLKRPGELKVDEGDGCAGHAIAGNVKINERTRKPGSSDALQAINSAIDFWVKCETGNGESF